MFRERPNTNPRFQRFARELRRAATPYERIMWSLLRDRRFLGFKFRRQQLIGPYIADFVCNDAKLIIELDGSQHADDPSDARRDAELSRRGYRVLRIWNSELTNNKQAVLEGILIALEARGRGHRAASTGEVS